MDRYECQVCGYIYDPEVGDPVGGVPPGVPFEELPDRLGLPPVRGRKRPVRPKGVNGAGPECRPRRVVRTGTLLAPPESEGDQAGTSFSTSPVEVDGSGPISRFTIT